MAAVRERRELTAWSSLCAMDCHDLEETKPLRAGPVPFANETNRQSTQRLTSSLHLDEYGERSQYIDMELNVVARDWEKASARARRLQKSRDSHEFEFDMFTIAPDLQRESKEVASADELFFKGQLLPLQHDPRFQLVQTLSNLQRDQSPTYCPLKEVSNFELCRLEGFSTDVNGLITDSRSSSFRSRRSSFWESVEKDSRDSISSRASNGSSQDAPFPAIKRPVSCVQSNQPRKDSHPKIERWSWRTLFNNLKKVSKICLDERGRDHADSRPLDESLRNIYSGGASQKLNTNGFGEFRTNKQLEKYALSSDHHAAGGQQQLSRKSTQQIKHKDTGHTSDQRWRTHMNKLKLRSWKISQHKQQEKSLIDISTIGSLRAINNCEKTVRPTASITCRSSSSTPLTKSPMRVVSAIHNSSNGSGIIAAASCPPSMRSSPHHSGILATHAHGNKDSSCCNHNINTMQQYDRHTSIQAAIDHCKQSQSRQALACTNPRAVYAECHLN